MSLEGPGRPLTPPATRAILLVVALVVGLAAFHRFGVLALLVPGLLAVALRGLPLLPQMGLSVAWGTVYTGLFHLWAWQADRSGWFALLLTRGLPWALFPLPQWMWERSRPGQGGPLSRAVLCGTATAVMAAVLTETPAGLDWDLPLAALAPWPWTLALLPWLGLTGGSALLGTLSHLLMSADRRSQGVGGVACGLVLLVNSWLAQRPTDAAPLPPIGLVQTGWPQEQKWLEVNRQVSKERLIRATGQAAEKGADLVIWPETAWPVRGMRALPEERREVGEVARRLGVEILASSWETEPNGWSNAVTAVDSSGNSGAFQAKRRLIPFQEYLPFPQRLEGLFRARGWHRNGAHFRPGQSATVFEVAGRSCAVLICYESVVPGPARSVADKVDFLVVMTNDASLVSAWPKEAHFRSAVLRAIECRKPVLQAANNGVGGWIDERGRVVARTSADPFLGWSVLMAGGHPTLR